jgi:hypothetical protein
MLKNPPGFGLHLYYSQVAFKKTSGVLVNIFTICRQLYKTPEVYETPEILIKGFTNLTSNTNNAQLPG